MPTHHHSHALKEAIIAHWQNGLPYSKIVKKINDSRIAKINKSSVWYQINKFTETKSTKNKPRSGWPWTVRTPEWYHSTRMKIQRNHKRSIFGLHPRQTWMSWILPYGEYWQEKHIKNLTRIWTASSVASSQLGMTLMLIQCVHVVKRLTGG